MNRLDAATRARVLSCLVEGLGVRPCSRATGVAVNTIQGLIREMGPVCLALHDELVRNLPTKRIEADESWAFCYSREKNTPPEKRGTLGYGDVWAWTALDADNKIVVSHHVGFRDMAGAIALLTDVSKRVAGRIELNTDGLGAYLSGVIVGFQGHVDYAKVVKTFQTPSGEWNSRENRYQQPAIKSIKKIRVCGAPDTANASTSLVERFNLGLRQHNKKFARLTNGHAKKLDMLRHSLAIYYAYYNFVKGHETLRGRTPAMASDITDRRWTVLDLVNLADGIFPAAAN